MCDRPIEIELRRSRKVLRVEPHLTILDALAAAGVDTLSDCRSGTCGICAVRVLEGTPEHRDCALSAADRARGDVMCICISRAKTPRLVLDL